LTLVLPVLLLILVAAVDVGRLFSSYLTIQNAAKEGAFFGASRPECTAPGVGCGDPNNTTWHANKDLSGLSGTSLTVTCIAASNGAPKPPATCLSGDAYQVTIDYPFALITPVAQLVSPLNLGATASSLVLNSAFVPSPQLSVVKSSTTTSITASGELVPYTYVIASIGNAIVTNIVPTDNNVSNPGVICPQTSLAPGTSMTCTASHRVTATEFSAGGSVSNIVAVTSSNATLVSTTLSIPITTPPACTAPIVTLLGTPTSGAGTVTVAFTGTSNLPAQSWLWDFGDGSTPEAGSGLQSPNTVPHSYTRGNGNGPQSWTPKLTVTTGATCSTTVTAPNKYITSTGP
jgi:Flp pilus assembly protein TadG